MKLPIDKLPGLLGSLDPARAATATPWPQGPRLPHHQGDSLVSAKKTAAPPHAHDGRRPVHPLPTARLAPRPTSPSLPASESPGWPPSPRRAAGTGPLEYLERPPVPAALVKAWADPEPATAVPPRAP